MNNGNNEAERHYAEPLGAGALTTNSVPIEVYSNTWVFIKEYTSINEAERKLFLKKYSIRKYFTYKRVKGIAVKSVKYTKSYHFKLKTQ